MFAPRFFAPRYFAPRYFPPALPVEPTSQVGGGGSAAVGNAYWRAWEEKPYPRRPVVHEVASPLLIATRLYKPKVVIGKPARKDRQADRARMAAAEANRLAMIRRLDEVLFMGDDWADAMSGPSELALLFGNDGFDRLPFAEVVHAG